MNANQKIATSLVAAAVISAVLFTSTSADSSKPSQPTVTVAAASQTQPVAIIARLNSPETPAEQLDDLQYN